MAPRDAWFGPAAYEAYVGRWSRLVGLELLAWLGVPPGASWVELGCGTGALSRTILAAAAPRSLDGFDRSAPFVRQARAAGGERCRFHVGDAGALAIRSGVFDAAISGLVLNFLPDPAAAAREMRRVTRKGGAVAAYVWDYAGEMQLMRRFWDAAVELDPAARELDEGPRFPLCSLVALQDLFAGAGLASVETRAIDVPTLFHDFDDYWTPFLGGQGPAPAYAMSLDSARRDRLRDRLRATLPIRPDGSIHLFARAFAVRGRS
ncbi:MAG TPA: class I SAM-dependent methyltransferase [Myxococcales bacterium]|nr:class I SAM-dependent methyltransferase [Myxococcales bacterium]